MPAEVVAVVVVVVVEVEVSGHPLARELCRRSWIELPAEMRVISTPNRIIKGKVINEVMNVLVIFRLVIRFNFGTHFELAQCNLATSTKTKFTSRTIQFSQGINI